MEKETLILNSDESETVQDINLLIEENDIIITLVSYIKERGNDVRINYLYTDNDMRLQPGSTKNYIEVAADEARYAIERKGDNLIWLRKYYSESDKDVRLFSNDAYRVTYDLMKDIIKQREIEKEKLDHEELQLSVKERYFKLYSECRKIVCDGLTYSEIPD